MGATLNALRELQDIELQITDLKRQVNRKARQVGETEKKLAELRRTMQVERDHLHQVQRDADLMDLDLKARTGHVGKLRDQLNSARTNKEYAAILAQLNTERADVSNIEKTTLEKLEQVEKLKAAFKVREEEEQRIVAHVDGLRQQHVETDRYFADRLAKLTADRDAVAGKLDSITRSLFARMSERYEGEALAKLVRTHPRRDDFICEGCNMTVNVERYNALRTRDDVQTCSNCGRILFVPE